MYTLDINVKKNVIMYIVVTVICFIASMIYLSKSYGVVSNYMKYLALIPLVLGVLVNVIIYLIKKIKISRLSNNMYNAGVATFIFGSAVEGGLEIYGANSFYTWIYLAIGIVWIVFSVISTIIYNLSLNKEKKI